MKEIIEEILQAEKEARTCVESAREKAKKNHLEAEEKAKKIQIKAREAATEEARQLLHDAETQAIQERENRLKAAAKDPLQKEASSAATIEKAARQIFQRVIDRERI